MIQMFRSSFTQVPREYLDDASLAYHTPLEIQSLAIADSFTAWVMMIVVIVLSVVVVVVAIVVVVKMEFVVVTAVAVVLVLAVSISGVVVTSEVVLIVDCSDNDRSSTQGCGMR